MYVKGPPDPPLQPSSLLTSTDKSTETLLGTNLWVLGSTAFAGLRDLGPQSPVRVVVVHMYVYV